VRSGTSSAIRHVNHSGNAELAELAGIVVRVSQARLHLCGDLVEHLSAGRQYRSTICAICTIYTTTCTSTSTSSTTASTTRAVLSSHPLRVSTKRPREPAQRVSITVGELAAAQKMGV
jgi:hypothetical protein|tara:strand:- start:434 stop:787 length:354 start_codon:yes stop_codon:yes gene_type:complete